jgi:hypothetical protein
MGCGYPPAHKGKGDPQANAWGSLAAPARCGIRGCRLLDVGRKVERERAGDRREHDADPSEQSGPEQLVEHVALHIFVTLRLQRIAPSARLDSSNMFGEYLFLVGFSSMPPKGGTGAAP